MEVHLRSPDIGGLRALTGICHFWAGFETTSTTLTFAIIGLAQHPDTEAKLLAEVDAFSWKEDAGIDFDDIQQFPYTRAVMDEAMRWALQR